MDDVGYTGSSILERLTRDEIVLNFWIISSSSRVNICCRMFSRHEQNWQWKMFKVSELRWDDDDGYDETRIYMLTVMVMMIWFWQWKSYAWVKRKKFSSSWFASLQDSLKMLFIPILSIFIPSSQRVSGIIILFSVLNG